MNPVADTRAPLQQADEPNQLLRALAPGDYRALHPLLVAERLPLRRVLAESGVPFDSAWFVGEGVASMIAAEQQGGPIEVATIGNEGLVGVPLLLDSAASGLRVLVQVEGRGQRVGAVAFRDFIDSRPAARHLFLRYVNYFTEQVAQGVACNRLHTLDERCARWLLLTRDRVSGDSFQLSHEFLSIMLGVRRAGVTVALGALQRAGMLRYSRARITILDRQALERAACDCYAITCAAYERFLQVAGDGRPSHPSQDELPRG